MDIGGTNIRAGVFPENGNTPITLKKIPTRGPETAQERAIRLISELWPKEHTVIALGITAPGPVDPRNGVVYSAPNIPDWRNLPLKSIISGNFGVPVSIGNDANMAALGEWKFGAGQGHHDILYLTISTGIGGGVILEDRLLLGWQGLASELGHVTVEPNGPLCNCGQMGHLEAVASGPAISRYVSTQIVNGRPSLLAGSSSLSAEKIAQAALKGDELAIEALKRAGEFIGNALADFLHVFNPSIIILGGGVSRSGKFFIDTIRNAIYQRVFSPQYTFNLKITTAALADDAGLLGALALARLNTPPGQDHAT